MTIETVNDLPGSAMIDPDGLVGKAAASAHETVDKAAEQTQRSFDRLATACQDTAEAPRNLIRAHPIASVVTALAVGFIWGRLGS